MDRSALVYFFSDILSKLFVELALDKSLFSIRLCGELLLLSMLTCGVVFTEFGDIKNVMLGGV